MRLIDAIPLSEGIELHRQSTDQEYELDYCWAEGFNAGLDCALHCIAYAKTITPSPNDPLTLDELREMDGEPVWVTRAGYQSRWALVFTFSKRENIIRLTFDNGSQPIAKTLLDGCKIYRRKPEEGTT